MKQLKEYTQYARDCREAAAKALTPVEREHLLSMAERWDVLARQRAAYMHLENALAELLKEKSDDGDAGNP